jgi:hypothetical protein
MRAAAIVVVAGVLVLGLASSGLAQGTPPTVTITASPTTLAVSGPTAIPPAGPTRFEIVKSGGDELEIAIAALRPGVSLDQFLEALRIPDSVASLDLVYLDGGASFTAGQERRAVTFNLRPNSKYVVVNLTGDNPDTWETFSFDVGGQPNGATAPQADARVRMHDLSFRGAKTLPRDGVVRFDNSGWAPHFAFTAPLRSGVKTRRVVRALRRNDEQLLGRLLNFEAAIEAQSLISRGAINYNEVRFPRRGRYAMMCFFDNHAAQGMWRIIRVK